jgi:predicted transcriptional regulator of viral defense system
MIFQDFRLTFQGYPVISRIEIEKMFSGFDWKNLVYWQQKKYLQKVRNSWYRLTESPLDTETLFFISNQIYQPSYVSLETALSYYGFIPEGVFKTTAVSTLKTQQFQTPIGNFGYQNIKPTIFFGYRLLPIGKHFYKMAEPEKAILDFVYLHSELNSESHFEGLRLNIDEFKSTINLDTLKLYLNLYNSPMLTKRVEILLLFIENK